jgi:Sulfatase
MQLARGILAGLIFLGLSGVVQAQSLTAGPSKLVAANSQQSNGDRKSRPNILFIIMDDVGIDQMSIFGYGGGTPPLTPNIDAVARAGVRFRNVWSMPECSPSRAIFFEGRYPLRTNIQAAILSDDLANSQVSPFEVTTPKILKKVGYQNALFGKFHLAALTTILSGLRLLTLLAGIISMDSSRERHFPSIRRSVANSVMQPSIPAALFPISNSPRMEQIRVPAALQTRPAM